MDFIRFFKQITGQTAEQWQDRLVRSLNSLASRIQGSVADGIEGLESRVQDLEDALPVTFGPVTLSGTSTSIITTIPSWARRVELVPESVSTNGTSSIIVQIGPSGGVATANYMGSGSFIGAATAGSELDTNGFRIAVAIAAADVYSGDVTLRLQNSSTNKWNCSSTVGRETTEGTRFSGGEVTLSGALTQITFTTVGGVNTFDSGTVSGTYYAN